MTGIFLFVTASRPALGPTQPPIQWIPWAFKPGVKRPGREANHSPPSSAEFKNEYSYTSTPPIHLCGQLIYLYLYRHNTNVFDKAAMLVYIASSKISFFMISRTLKQRRYCPHTGSSKMEWPTETQCSCQVSWRNIHYFKRY